MLIVPAVLRVRRSHRGVGIVRKHVDIVFELIVECAKIDRALLA